MIIRILTLFKDVYETYLSQTIHKRIEENDINIEIINIRDYSVSKHKTMDDSPFGGGAGMLLKPEAYWHYFKKLRENKIKKPYTIFVSPQGKRLNQEMVKELSIKDDICIISGRYEGLDERVIEKFVDLEVSIGDYVLSSGDLPSLVLIDSIIRLKDGIIKKESYETDSFYNGLLGYAQYTRPSIIDNMKVPDVLLSGNHKEIENFRFKSSILKTLKNRPDLIIKKLEDEDFKKEYEKILIKNFKDGE